MAVLEQFCANDSLKQTLFHMLTNGKLFHAYLLEGENGLGKKTFARYMAAAFLCEQNHHTHKETSRIPCGACESCHKILQDIHPDVQLFESQGKRSFHVDDIRKIRSGLYILPNEGDWRIYILAGAEDMTVQAQNALLKSLEEPPSHTIFILTCQNRALLLPTVLSRLLCLKVSAPSLTQCVDYIAARNPQFTRTQITEQAVLCENNIGKTLQNLSDPAVGKVEKTCAALADAVIRRDSGALLKAVSVFEKDKILFQESLLTLKTALHKAATAKCKGEISPHPLTEKLKKSLPLSRLMSLEELCSQTIQTIHGNGNHTLLLTWFTSRLL